MYEVYFLIYCECDNYILYLFINFMISSCTIILLITFIYVIFLFTAAFKFSLFDVLICMSKNFSSVSPITIP